MLSDFPADSFSESVFSLLFIEETLERKKYELSSTCGHVPSTPGSLKPKMRIGILITKTFLGSQGSQKSLLVYVTIENSDIKHHHQPFVLIRKESLVSFLWTPSEKY